MELLNLRLLRDLVQDPHLSRVAQRYHLTQSALSKRLQKLEDELSVKLFDRRGPRGLEPTGAAREMARLSDQVTHAWDAGLHRVKRHQDEPAHFSIVGPQIFMREVFLPWWVNTSPKHPELSLEVHTSALSRVSFDLVQAGMDVGVLEHKEDLEDFICKPIFTESWGIVSHAKTKVELDQPDSLKKIDWATVSPQNNPVEEWLVRRQKIAPPIYRLYWNDLTSLANWIADTPRSASVLPMHACQSLLDQKRVNFASLGRDSKRTLYLAFRQNHPHRKFISEILTIAKV